MVYTERIAHLPKYFDRSARSNVAWRIFAFVMGNRAYDWYYSFL